jgi:hypothetical protein
LKEKIEGEKLEQFSATAKLIIVTQHDNSPILGSAISVAVPNIIDCSWLKTDGLIGTLTGSKCLRVEGKTGCFCFWE